MPEARFGRMDDGRLAVERAGRRGGGRGLRFRRVVRATWLFCGLERGFKNGGGRPFCGAELPGRESLWHRGR